MTKKKSEPKDNNSIHKLALERYDKAVKGDQDEAELAQFDLKFHAGDQWPEALRQKRDATGRPCLTINLLPEKTDQVIGDMRQNKPQIKVKPVDNFADPETAEVLDGLIRQIFYQSDADLILDHASESQIICGRGAFRGLTRYVDEEDPFNRDQEIILRWIPNVFSVKIDPAAQDYDKQDARYMFITEEMSPEEFKDKYPKAISADSFPADDEQYHELRTHWYTADTVTVAEYFERRSVEKEFALLDDGSVVELKDVPEGVEPVETGKAMKREIWWSKLSGSEVLEGPRQLKSKYFPIFMLWGKESNVAGRRSVRGMTRHAIDPQRMFNYWESKTTETVALAPNAPYMATPKQIPPEAKKLYDDSANGELVSVLYYEPDKDAPGKPERITPPSIPTGLENRAAVNRDLIKSTTGIYDASVGAPSNEQSGVAISKRDIRAARGAYVYADNMNRTLRTCGRWIIDMIPYIYDADRVVRILGLDGEPMNVNFGQSPEGGGAKDVPPEQRIFDPTVGKFDVVVTTGPNYTTAREEMLQGMGFLMQTAPDITPVLLPRLAKSMEWPEADKIADDLAMMQPLPLMMKYFRERGKEPPPEIQMLIEQQTASQEPPPAPKSKPRNTVKDAVEAIKALTEARAAGVPPELIDRVGQMIEQREGE